MAEEEFDKEAMEAVVAEHFADDEDAEAPVNDEPAEEADPVEETAAAVEAGVLDVDPDEAEESQEDKDARIAKLEAELAAANANLKEQETKARAADPDADVYRAGIGEKVLYKGERKKVKLRRDRGRVQFRDGTEALDGQYSPLDA